MGIQTFAEDHPVQVIEDRQGRLLGEFANASLSQLAEIGAQTLDPASSTERATDGRDGGARGCWDANKGDFQFPSR